MLAKYFKSEYLDWKWFIIQVIDVFKIIMELDNGVKRLREIGSILIIDSWELGGVYIKYTILIDWLRTSRR